MRNEGEEIELLDRRLCANPGVLDEKCEMRVRVSALAEMRISVLDQRIHTAANCF